MSDIDRLILPSEIPWKHYVGEPLEELLYWLCDALGATDLQWRAGSATGTSRDRGRDLEATFHVPMVDGELEAQCWWIQAKGRSGTVPPQAVRDAAVEVRAHDRVDVLVIATNSRFSNDTRDWVAEFQTAHRRPLLRLWDREALERMVVKHPSVVARVAPEALSLAGQLEVAGSMFWDRQQLPTQGQLDVFWNDRNELSIDDRVLLALVVGDAAAGRLVHHPWGAETDDDLLLDTLGLALVNIGHLVLRGERTGVDHQPLTAGVAHLIACALMRTSARVVAAMLSDPWSLAENGPEVDDETRETLRELLCRPFVAQLFAHFGTACIEDCVRMLGDFEPDVRVKPEHRFLELLPTTVSREDATPDPRTILMEKQDARCMAGLELSPEHGCPFGAVEDRPWEELFTELQIVLANRLGQTSSARTSSGDEKNQPS